VLAQKYFFQDFLMASNPITFRIRIFLPKAFQPQEDICLDNDKTKERLLTEMTEADNGNGDQHVLQISRSLASKKKWIGKRICQKTIYLTKELKVVPM
jgi:hypothetical protein